MKSTKRISSELKAVRSKIKQTGFLGIYDIFILFLGMYVLFVLALETFFKLPPLTLDVLQIVDTVICLVFLGDFFVRLYRAESKLQYLKWGWIDFISAIPTVDMLRIGRAFRIIRVIRIIRGIRSAKQFVNIIFKNKAQTIFTSMLMVSFFLIVFASIAILSFEVTADANIKSAQDAFWWALVTLTTVGYGDHYPVTFEGQMLAVILMIAGIGLFGTFTGYISKFFMDSQENDELPDHAIEERLTRIEKKLDKLLSTPNGNKRR